MPINLYWTSNGEKNPAYLDSVY